QYPAEFITQANITITEVADVISAETLLRKNNAAPLNPLRAWSQAHIPGGTGAIKSQRLCAMQAFAKYRLQLAPLPEPQLGLTAAER
ncbi:hypothetical protein ABTM23_19415, partial [Acinetobacter baumannii]